MYKHFQLEKKKKKSLSAALMSQARPVALLRNTHAERMVTDRFLIEYYHSNVMFL